MNLEQLSFCEEYEKRAKGLELLKILEKVLTSKGNKTYASEKDWLINNMDRYLTSIQE